MQVNDETIVHEVISLLKTLPRNKVLQQKFLGTGNSLKNVFKPLDREIKGLAMNFYKLLMLKDGFSSGKVHM
jgi:hypothetical protein